MKAAAAMAVGFLHVRPRPLDSLPAVPRPAGEDAYQPERFGDRLTIERLIKGGSGSDYRVYDARDRRVPNGKKQLVDAILDHFNVNAANPLAVLTQDTARNFLSGAGSAGQADRKKYDLFMQATMLEEFR